MTDNDNQPGPYQYGPPPGQPPMPPPILAVEQPAAKKTAPKWLVGLTLGLVGLCGLCGIGAVAAAVMGGDDEPAAVEAPPTASPSAEAEPEAEEPTEEPELPAGAMELLYVQVLRDSPYAMFGEFSDEQLVAMGEVVCDEIDDEGLLPRMVRLAADPEVDAQAAGYLTGAAVTAFCPEYTADMQEMEEFSSGG